MWFAAIASVLCFAVTIIMFTPQVRSFPFYRPVALFFLFESLWLLINGAVLEVSSSYDIMLYIQYLGIAVFSIAMFFCFRIYSKQNVSDSDSEEKNSNKGTGEKETSEIKETKTK